MTNPWRLDWPTSRGHRVASGHLKASAADFLVDEQLDMSGCQSGEHLCVRLEKTGDNTEFVARELAKLAECRSFDVGFCGLKDRHAITRQWFSLYRPGRESDDDELLSCISAIWPVMDSCRSQKKLRRSDHAGNRFELTLTEVSGQIDEIDQALADIQENGCPNYFGAQRFGHNGGNLDQAVRMDPTSMIAGRKGKKRGRVKRTSGGSDAKNVLYFSAARSWLFNEVLAYRVGAANWQTLLDGEPGLSGPEETTVITGPMWGDGGTEACGLQGDMEREVVARSPNIESVFAQTRMKPERRPLMLLPEHLEWSWLDDRRLRIRFGLQPGQYATTLLSDVFELVENGGIRANSVVQ